jgi:hypothetical protein
VHRRASSCLHVVGLSLTRLIVETDAFIADLNSASAGDEQAWLAIAITGCSAALCKAYRTSEIRSSMSNSFCEHPDAPRVPKFSTSFA